MCKARQRERLRVRRYTGPTRLVPTTAVRLLLGYTQTERELEQAKIAFRQAEWHYWPGWHSPAYQACCSQPTLGPRRWRSGDEPEDWRKRERLKLPRDDSPSSSPTSSFTPRAQNVPRQHPRPLRYFVRSTAATPRYLRPTS
ncbi:hypothetical protein CABS01_14462 [Colletotrichum abscissum]|uniref:Uncharacterized protein n=1 Tax=Colletotrichum abscissum TaxID=1671311 RepID=A0A9P9XFR1_9PEZI|nr:uncharacterized protein CABS01_14462 [Colletotrichum abscissum]KAI3553342.1 hypothetical protein CABS02_06483 [Colletotrichum abscissum]KAK1480324.1 hypothetical protein CABS01_14462 [Colletotrichum abscissum]